MSDTNPQDPPQTDPPADPVPPTDPPAPSPQPPASDSGTGELREAVAALASQVASLTELVTSKIAPDTTPTKTKHWLWAGSND